MLKCLQKGMQKAMVYGLYFSDDNHQNQISSDSWLNNTRVTHMVKLFYLSIALIDQTLFHNQWSTNSPFHEYRHPIPQLKHLIRYCGGWPGLSFKWLPSSLNLFWLAIIRGNNKDAVESIGFISNQFEVTE